MPGKPRQHQRGESGYYHIMNRGHNREVVYRHDEDLAHFLQLLARYQRRFAVRLFHNCPKNNHFHLLVQCENPRELSPWMAGLLRAYVHYFDRRYACVVHLWQGRFRSPAVEVESYFLSCAR